MEMINFLNNEENETILLITINSNEVLCWYINALKDLLKI